MSCFHLFKEKVRQGVHKTDPVGKRKNKSGVEEDNRATRSSGAATASRGIPVMYEEKSRNLRVFTYAEMSRATGNFQRMLQIGEGGFGCVYKGTILENGHPSVVAIKKLNASGYQGHKQWITEVQLLGVADHPNVVKLIGYCAVDGERGIQRLLVYEYMHNKSLDDHLFNDSKPVLSWDQRLQIMLGAAQGLAYLHEELEIQVIYRDFKSSNVLLDEEFKPKLSDFGLAREGPEDDDTHVSTAVVGTYGYAAPDYVKTGHLNSKSDVWSFGVVLYEILTGRRSMERNLPKSQQRLLDWVKHYPAESRKFSKIVDPRLENQYSLTAAQKISKLADSCLVKSAKDRPKMSQVVEVLKHIIEISNAGTSPTEHPDATENVEEVPPEQVGTPVSAARRMAHLAQISQNVEGADIGRFIMMHRAVRAE